MWNFVCVSGSKKSGNPLYFTPKPRVLPSAHLCEANNEQLAYWQDQRKLYRIGVGSLDKFTLSKEEKWAIDEISKVSKYDRNSMFVFLNQIDNNLQYHVTEARRLELQIIKEKLNFIADYNKVHNGNLGISTKILPTVMVSEEERRLLINKILTDPMAPQDLKKRADTKINNIPGGIWPRSSLIEYLDLITRKNN